VEVAVMKRDRAFLDSAAVAGGLEDADETVVDLAGDERRTLREREAEQPPCRLVGDEDAPVRIESHDARVEQESKCPDHRQAVRAGKQVDRVPCLHPGEYKLG
jgi:hypothetical protein